MPHLIEEWSALNFSLEISDENLKTETLHSADSLAENSLPLPRLWRSFKKKKDGESILVSIFKHMFKNMILKWLHIGQSEEDNISVSYSAFLKPALFRTQYFSIVYTVAWDNYPSDARKGIRNLTPS